MIDLSRIERIDGPNLSLRLITPEDAGYVQNLRTDPIYNRYLSKVRGTVSDQRRWLKAYKAREIKGGELYYVIERRDGTHCGLVRLYDIGDESFTWGSWILDAGKPRKAALESALLSFGVGFRNLNLFRALVDARIENERACAFYIRLGMEELYRDEQDIYFVYERKKFDADRDNLLKIIEQETQS